MKYLKRVLIHKWYVFWACMRIGGISFWRALTHDWSKISPYEFMIYTKDYKSYGYSDEDFDIACMHHIHYNPHHWEHWVFQDKALPMPKVYIREMVADWIGTGQVYNGALSPQKWLNENYKSITLHEDSLSYLKEVLSEIDCYWPPDK